jgi:molecular chaperone GrpE
MEQNETINNSEENTSENTVNPSEEQQAEPSIENTVDLAIDYEAKLAELNDRYLRLYSEFDNYRKRTIKEKSDIIRSAGEDVFKAIIPTIDDFERAIKANEVVDEAEPIKEGMVLIYNKLVASCTSKGLEPMNSLGVPFNSDIMEAITHIPAPTEDLKGKVVDDIEKGYKLGDKVIRFAKVVVGN